MKFTAKFILCLVFISFFLGCKKGENDPLISPIPRKDRVAGKWKLKSGSATYTYSYYSQTYTFSGLKQFSNLTTSNSAAYILDLHISKKGTFNVTELNGTHQFNASGTWSFNSGVGKEKAKQKITFFITKVSSGYSDGYYFFNRNCMIFTYDIDRLTNKNMKLTALDKLMSYDKGSDEVLSVNYNFETE
jgi:hypothetical protein